MNRPYALAAVLALFAAAIRTWDGETGPLKVVRELDLGREIVGFFHLTWYMVTIVFVLAACVLGYFALNSEHPGAHVAGFMSATLFLTWSMCIAIVSSVFVWHPGTAIPMSVTILIGVLALLGAGKSIRADPQQ